MIRAKTALSVTVLCIVFPAGFLLTSYPQSGRVNPHDWSDPELFYAAPDTSEILRFEVVVYGGKISVSTSDRIMKDNRYLEFSEILFIQKEPGKEPEMRQLTSDNIPSEQPVVLRDQSGNLHLLWGDRRQDPGFDKWEIPRPQLSGFSTNVVYTRYDGLDFESPESIYEGNLSTFGVGDIGYPLQMAEDEMNRLHVVFKADSAYMSTTPDGEEAEAFVPHATYMYRSPSGEWSRPRFLEIGSNPGIAVLPGGRLVVAWLGSAGQSSINDVLVISSDDNGLTWSEPDLVFQSGRQMSILLRLIQSADGRLHLVWGRVTGGLPIRGEIWHSYSEDEGSSWSEPVRFFILPQSPEIIQSFIGDYDIITDEHNQLHWTGVEQRRLQNGDSLSFVHYNQWDPLTAKWEEGSILDFINETRQVRLSEDQVTKELFLFWEDDIEKAVYYTMKKPAGPVLPPVTSESGPLQLHANFPNPFNPSTVVLFSLEESGEVVLTIYDTLGRKVVTRELGMRQPGFHRYEISMDGLAGGMYMYEITLNGRFRQQEKMMYAK